MLAKQLIERLPEGSSELANLINRVFDEDDALSEAYRYGVALAAAGALRNRSLVAEVRPHVSASGQALVQLATARMGVTNPYFQARMEVEVGAGGSLQALAMSPLQELAIDDEIGYHYFAMAIAVINGGMPCFRSHMMSLLDAGQPSQAIDQTLRIAAALHSIDQLSYLQAE
ncbi:carboxymuconolactone decarboxylase family protein [Marinobacterium arenosum]|uniref:carboxymuconolactone decarboxylase family protein n=1 Tax=Marinobacterium arenosum TaxID=2862496 RepID=UPI001C9704C4|nr:carboxymuconolactone decarboxylase family protein [Marinobacterium arenosum]MBY4676510.1 carboxymuconolactone decarboxylase family protein [Marinobacterium arenosum]